MRILTTIAEIEAQERELEQSRNEHRRRLLIINRQLQRLARRRHNLLLHPSWKETAARGALKR